VKSLVNFEARDLEQWSRQVNGTTFLCLASVHHQKSNLNLIYAPGELESSFPSGVAKMLTLCNLPKAAEAITEVTSNHLESWI
jgi:hypothetical protein